jgi:hypothetical protein
MTVSPSYRQEALYRPQLFRGRVFPGSAPLPHVPAQQGGGVWRLVGLWTVAAIALLLAAAAAGVIRWRKQRMGAGVEVTRRWLASGGAFGAAAPLAFSTEAAEPLTAHATE